MVFQQRNGRVDRYGQAQEPQILYLFTATLVEKIHGDLRILLFGHHRAPVIQSHYLTPSEQAFVMLGLVPNRKGQPLLVDWQVAGWPPGQPFTLEPYDAFVQRAGLQAGQLPNPGLSSSLQDLQAALPEAVACMHQHMVQRQAAFAEEMQQRLQGTLADLERLQAAQVQQLELRLEGGWSRSGGASSSGAAGSSGGHSTSIVSGWRIL